MSLSLGMSSLPSSESNSQRKSKRSSVKHTKDKYAASKEVNHVFDLFLDDSSNLSELCQLDIFRKDCFIPNTVFEEIELYSLFDIYHSKLSLPSSNNDAQSESSNSALLSADNPTALRKAIKRLYLQALYEDDKGSPLVSFQLILHKRLQILDKFQSGLHSRLKLYSELKSHFEQLPISPIPEKNSHEDHTVLHKHLQKAMLKSDTKKGLLSQFRRSRHESIYRILAKHASHPLSMVGMDTENVRDYLLEFCCNANQPRRKRVKAYSSLIFLGLGHGSIEDILKIIHATLSFSIDPNAMSDIETEENGILIRPEVFKSLQRFQQYVQSKEGELRDSSKPSQTNNNPIYQKYALPTSCKKPLSVVHMFCILVQFLDILNNAYENVDLLVKMSKMSEDSLKTAWQEYVIEMKPSMFDNILSLVDKLIQMRGTNNIRSATVLSLFRVLKLNIRVLSLWNNASLSRRFKSQKQVNFIEDLRAYIITFLKEQHDLYIKYSDQGNIPDYKEEIDKKHLHPSQQQSTRSGDPSVDLQEQDDMLIVTPKRESEVPTLSNIGEDIPSIFESICEVLVQGFTLFYPKSEDQLNFIQESLDDISTDPVKKLISKHLSKKLVKDTLFFKTIMIEGLKDTGRSSEFLGNIIQFIQKLTLYKIKNTKDVDPDMECILSNMTTVLLLYQNHILHKVSHVPVRQRKPTVPDVGSLQDIGGKHLFDFMDHLLKCCVRLLVESCGCVDEENRPHIQQTLKSGLVGRVIYPLLQNVIKLLWRSHNSPQERQSISLLFNFIYPSISDLLRSINSLNIMVGISEPIFEWKIIETCHPYQTNSSEDIRVHFSNLPASENSNVQTEPIAVTVKFDPRCRTACQSDNLRITSKFAPPKSDTSPSLQFSGHGSSIPVNPLVSWGDELSIAFRSDDKQTDWGMKLSVFPLYHYHWLYEFEKYLGWIGGRFATFSLSEYAYTDSENCFADLLLNRPFCYGIKREVDSEKPTENSSEVENFLDGISNLNHPSSKSLVDFMQKYLRAESMMLHDQEQVIKAERHIIAAILYHSHLGNAALEFTHQMVNQMHQEVPKSLIQVWRQARNIRMWMVQTKQMQQKSYESLCSSIVEKVSFLLSLFSGLEEVSHNPSESGGLFQENVVISPSSQQATQTKPSSQQEPMTQSIRTSSSKMQKRSDSVDQFTKIRKMKHRTEENDISNVDQVSKVILDFVKSDASVKKLSKVMKLRTSRANSRAQALQSLAELFECTQFYSVKCEILKDAKYILRSKGFNHAIDFHYLSNTEGCTMDATNDLTSTFTTLVRMLIAELDDWESESVVLSGMLREIMEICFFSFKPCDVQWVLRFKFLEKLCPLMYDNPSKHRNGEKLVNIPSFSEEKKEVRKKAWKIFRMLSVRCVEMLEQWDEKEKFLIQSHKRDEVRSQIDDLRDKIFGLFFDELEDMIQNNNIFSDVLEEMLSLMVSLCNTASAQICLSSKRFQRLLLPLLRVGIPKVQELSLQLCSQLILSSNANLNDENDVEDENSLKLLHVLFEFLGSYQISQVLGKDPTSSQRTLIPLHMAKEIFCLLRKLFHESAPSQWRSDIRSLMETNIHEMQSIIYHVDDQQLDENLVDQIKRLLATLAVLSGFSYIPTEGERVQVKLNGKWEDAKVGTLEENRHSMTFLLSNKKYLNKEQRIESEWVKVKTDHCLDPKEFELSEDHINDIVTFVCVVGDHVYKNSFDASRENAVQNHTLLRASLSSFLQYIHRLLENPLCACKPQLLRALLNNSQSIVDLGRMETNLKYGRDHKLDCCSFAFTGKQFTRQYYYSCLTCGMSNTKAVCSYCAKTCHRGHRLGKPELGEFYCDCGAGEGKHRCKSLKKSAPESVISISRLDSILLRLHHIMPLFQEVSKSQQNTSYFIGRSQLNNQTNSNQIIGPTRFVIQPAQTRTGYFVNTSTHEISFSQSNANGFSMIGTDYCIPKNWHGFYFEVEIVDCGARSGVCIGISEKLQCNKPWPQVLKTSYSLFLSQSSATLYKGTSVHKTKYCNIKLHQGDIIGVGYAKDQGHLFFTRNGKNLGHAFENLPKEGEPFFPTLVLRGDTVRLRANLGQTSFLFGVSEAYSSINVQQHQTSSSFPTKPKTSDSIESYIKDLRSACFYDNKSINEAIQEHGDNINAVASHLHRSSVKPLHHTLVEKMRQMGFEEHMCFRALKASGNEIQQAIDSLIEGQIDDSPQTEEERLEYQVDINDFGFLGADTFQSDFDQELSRGMLQNPDTKVNTTAYTDVDIYKVSVNDLVVINPHLKEMGKTGAKHSLYPLRSRMGVVIRKLLNGAYIQTFDCVHSTFMTSFVGPEDLRSCPKELKNLSLSNVANECLDLYRNVSILYSREILSLMLQQVDSVAPMDLSRQSLYDLIKVLFAGQYDIQHPNPVSATVKIPQMPLKMIKHIKKLMHNDQSMVDYLAPIAEKELVDYSTTYPHARKIIFRSAINARPQYIRIFGASSIYIKFADNCQLQTEQDVLIFTYDRNGRKIARSFKGPLVLPKHCVIHGAEEIWFHFKVSSLQEGSGFEFYAVGGTYRLPEPLAFKQPNMALASSILENVSDDYLSRTSERNGVFTNLVKYLLIPFAPFKVSVCHSLHNMLHFIKQSSVSQRPDLSPIKRFRLELEVLRRNFENFSATIPHSLPVFHAVIDWYSALRMELSSDLCTGILSLNSEKHHIYQYKVSKNDNVRKLKGCPSCMTIHSLESQSALENTKYYGYGKARCELHESTNLQWHNKHDSENLFPIHHISANPGDWFEHSSWLDQLAIVRQLAKYFNDPTLPCPKWMLFETALETKKKVQYRESEHPYKIINDEGMIRIPGAKTLFISFDKHSQTHKCDKLCFSSKFAGAEDLGAFSGEELKDKTLIVHGNTVHYKFKSDGGNHECTCNHCGKRIMGVRFHCTVCDDFDLCSRCISKVRVHHETHIFLKIRRPVDCVPASLPLLYTSRWANSVHYRSNHHYGVKCNACGKSPIVGVRYWCENCEDYNLCEKCAEEEYTHHDRMHVFLRVLRPLPPKSQMPLNALPYGLVYEKELDTHWGYLFSVSSTDANYRYTDEKMQGLTKQIEKEIKPFSPSHDADLVKYIESHCKQGWQSLEWKSLKLNDNHLMHYPQLRDTNVRAIRYRFIALKLLNRKVSRVLHLLSFDDLSEFGSDQRLSELISKGRNRIFHSVKMDAWNHSVHNSLIEINPISMHLNRHLAAEESNLSEQSAYNSLFNQAFKQAHAINPRVLSRKGGAWKITFVGESADDYGGPFRESLNQICTELQSLDQLDLLIPIPNREEGQGENREKFMPNPRGLTRRYEKWYHFLGILIGVGLLSKNVLPLDLPSLFWKHIVQEKITTEDLQAIDLMQYQSLQSLEVCDGVTSETFGDIFFHNFVISASDGTEIELVPNGKNVPVTYENRMEYVEMAKQYKLHEIDFQMKHVLSGLYSIIPPRYFPVFSWTELERLICGDPQIDLKVLKKHTIYEGYTGQSKQVKDFWTVMQKFSQKERSMFLRFVWGRSRLPVSEEGYTHPMKIQKLERNNADEALPLSHTCFFSLELPPYSSKKVLHERLLFAITYCRSIDTDNHPTRVMNGAPF